MLSLKLLYNSPLATLITGRKRTKSKLDDDGSEVVSADLDPSLDDDPLRAAYIRGIPKAQLYKGVLLQGYLVPPAVLEGLDSFEIRSDDVFIITYPKSGTTWTEEIVSLIFNNGNPKKVNKLLVYRVQHLEVGRPIGHLRHLKSLKSPRLMATHLPLDLIPQQLREAKCKIIYVVRNPKDNAVSYYHHHRMSTFLGNFSGSWNEFFSYYLKGHMVYGSWFDHVLPYWKFYREHPDKVLFISFEELKMDLVGMVGRIANFLNRPLSSDAIRTIANHCSFEQMKNNSMVNREVLPISDLFDMTQSKFMRKGIVGDWKNYFTPEQNAAFDEVYQQRMEGTGLDLVFEPEDACKRMSVHGRIILPPAVRLWNAESNEDIQHGGSSNSECNSSAAEDDETGVSNDNLHSSSESDVSVEERTEVCRPKTRIPHVIRRTTFCPLQVHIQPDPLTLDTI